ncbi:MAG: hypothetical protein OHK0046_09090 [Anaerolineae bacterium]
MTETTTTSVLITQGDSGAGRAITRQLRAAGYKAASVTNTQSGAAAIRAAGGLPTFVDTLRAGEVKSAIQMTKAEAIVNLYSVAAVGLPYRVNEDAQLVERTTALLAGAEASSVKFIVHVSPVLLYGAGHHVDESAPLKAEGAPLMAALKQCEKLVQSSSIPSVILRAGYIYGPHSTELQNLAEALRGGIMAIMSSKKHASWVHEDDLAHAVALAVQQQPNGEVFNIVDDTPTSTEAFLESFAEEQGLQTTPRLMALLGRSYSNRAANNLLAVDVTASNAKAKEALGWSPRYAAQHPGIEHTLLIWRAEAAAKA